MHVYELCNALPRGEAIFSSARPISVGVILRKTNKKISNTASDRRPMFHVLKENLLYMNDHMHSDLPVSKCEKNELFRNLDSDTGFKGFVCDFFPF
ncbi:hypothetical protein TNCV_1788741 [Trichonephila clavipes]|nr:hypothetical protein TNCV_1788741 [Trichonephila clavipes]